MKSKSNVIQFLTYAAVFSSSIFIPIYCKQLGGSDFAVGMVVAVYNCAFFISSYIFGLAADRGNIKSLLYVGLLASALVFASQIFISNLIGLFILRALAGFVIGIYPAALSIYAFHERQGLMGHFAGYGALGWAAASIVASVFGNYNFLFLSSSVFFFATFLVSIKFKPFNNDVKVPLLPWNVVIRNFRLYLDYFLRNLGAQAVWSIFPLYLLSIGANKFWIGMIYFANCFPQFIIARIVEKYRNILIIKLGLLFSVIAFYFFAVSTIWVLAIPIQILIAFSFATLQVGIMQELLKKNREKGTVIGILNSIVNFCAIIGPIFAGLMAHYFGYPSIMYAAAILSVIGFFI